MLVATVCPFSLSSAVSTSTISLLRLCTRQAKTSSPMVRSGGVTVCIVPTRSRRTGNAGSSTRVSPVSRRRRRM